jgi:hypothetical protein
MKTNVTKMFVKCFSDSSLHCGKLNEFLSKFVKCFSDISLHYRKLDEFLLKFVNVLATVVFIVLSLMNYSNVTKTLANFNKNSSSLRQWKIMSVKRWRTLIIIHQAYNNDGLKLDELLLKFVNVLVTLVFIVVSLMNYY